MQNTAEAYRNIIHFAESRWETKLDNLNTCSDGAAGWKVRGSTEETSTLLIFWGPSMAIIDVEIVALKGK